MIYTVTLNPALDKTVQIPNFRPGEVNRIAALRTDPGGKGINVSKVLHALAEPNVAAAILGGAEAVLAGDGGMVEDGGAAGQRIADALQAIGVEGLFLFTQHETRTNLKLIDPVQHTNTDINEPGAPVPPGTADALLEKLTARLADGDLVVLSGSVPAGLPETVYRDWTLACKKAGAAVFLDADGVLLRHGLEAQPALIKPNLAELSGVTSRPLQTAEDAAQAARALLDRGVGCVAVTLGADGALFCWPDCMLRAECPRVPVGSTVGAGDSVVAALAYARQHGLAREAAARLAMAAGTANVMCSGTQAAPYQDVAQLLPQIRLTQL